MNFTCSCSLLIKGKDILNFDDINNNLKIKASSVMKKGEIRSKIVGAIQNDIWIYEIKAANDENLNTILEKLLKTLKPVKNYISKLNFSQNVCIRCHIQSNDAQIYFLVSPSIISNLAELKLPIEVSILSWGEVDD